MLKRELKINLKSLIIWTGIIVSICILVFGVYPSIINSESANNMDEIMKMFPEDMLKAFNMDLVSLDSVLGWFQSEGYVFIVLIGSLYAAILGGTILIKEESDKTIEFLQSKPISNSQIVTSRVVCGVINISIFVVVIALTTLIGFLLSNDFNFMKWIYLTIAPSIIYYAFFFISMFLSTFMKKSRQSTNISLAIVLLTYLLQMIAGMSDKLKFLKYLSPFELFDSRLAITDEILSIPRMIFGVTLVCILIFGIYHRYNKKELVA